MIGKIISHYKITDKIGSGGMGTVYKAEDLTLNRIVALKFLPMHLTEHKKDVIRFKREAQSAAILNHQNICTIHEIAEAEGYFFIVMSYIEGSNLKNVIQESPLPLSQAINYAIQIAEGLQEAHEKGVIHRDIKSANIIITPKKKAVIMDFGLAKMERMPHITSPGTSMGTSFYMSPEQARGEDIDYRSDIWGLGIILYEMITGELPIKGKMPHIVIYKILNKDPIAFKDLPEDSPSGLVEILKKALAKNISERYQSIADFKNDLMHFAESSADLMIKQLPLQLKRRGVKRVLKYILPILVLSLTVALIIFFNLFLKTTVIAAKSIAVLPFRDISPTQDQQYFCDGMTEQLITTLSRIPELTVIARTSIMRYRNTDIDVRKIGKELGVEYLIEGSVLKVGDDIRITAEMIKAEDGTHIGGNNYNGKLSNIFMLQDNVSKEIALSMKVKLSKKAENAIKSILPKNVQAYDFYMRAKYYIENNYLNSGSEEDFNQAVALAKKALEIEPDFALGYFGLSYIYEHKYQVTLDPGCIKEALTYSMKSLDLNPDLPEANAALGYYFSRNGQADKAYEYLKRAYEVNPNNTTILYTIASFYSNIGLLDSAIEYYTKAINIDPFTFYLYDSRGYNYFCLGQVEKAFKDIEKAIKLQMNHPGIIDSMANICIVKKEFDRANELINKLNSFPSYKKNVIELKGLLSATRGLKEESLKYTNESAAVYSLLGMHKDAVNIIEKNILKNSNDRSLSYLYLKNYPFYSSIQKNPVFQNILQKTKKIYESHKKSYPLQNISE